MVQALARHWVSFLASLLSLRGSPRQQGCNAEAARIRRVAAGLRALNHER
jgi:hypothetical protein